MKLYLLLLIKPFSCVENTLSAVGQLKWCIIYIMGLNNLFPVTVYKIKNGCYLLFQLQKRVLLQCISLAI